jgi:hypothetical protein
MIEVPAILVVINRNLANLAAVYSLPPPFSAVAVNLLKRPRFFASWPDPAKLMALTGKAV